MFSLVWIKDVPQAVPPGWCSAPVVPAWGPPIPLLSAQDLHAQLYLLNTICRGDRHTALAEKRANFCPNCL